MSRVHLRVRDPLARIGAIKLKLGALLVGGVAVSTAVITVATASGAPVWLAVTVAAALALVTIDLLGTGMTAPLRQMAEQADRLADGLPVDEVEESARDEVGALARAFNRMAREVAHTDRLRRELVANVSHELRTPLAAMSAVVENLVDGVEETTPASLGRLEAQTVRLRALVDRLLDLSSLDAGAVRLDRRPTPTAELVADAVAACGADADGRVETWIAPDAEVLDVDPDRFRQVLVNLVGNALRHGPADEQVVVRATRERRVTAAHEEAERRDEVVLVVADRGPGIAMQDAERVFERFARSDEGRATAVGGAGLGLPIARWVVALHGGTLTVERHDGPGARLRVSLPTAVGPTRAGDRDHHHDEESTMTSPRHPGTTPPSPPLASGSAPTVGSGDAGAAGLRVLPTPVAGLRPRGLVAVVAAAVVAALVGVAALEDGAGLGLAVLLGSVGLAALAGRERPLDGFGWTCASIALAIVTTSLWTDAAWVVVPGILVAVVVAGLGFWGPTRAGEVLRALVVGPLLTIATPVAVVRGVRTGGASQLRRWVVPGLTTLGVLLVFGGLLVEGDAAFAGAVDAVLPDLRLDVTLVLRALLAALAATATATYLLVQRAGTIETEPWRRPVRPRPDWFVPVVALDVLLVVALVVRAGVLFGGEERVLATTGLTYAEYARDGFGSLLALATLVLLVVGVVARVAADEDRTVRDRVLGVLLAATGVVLASAAQRLVLYAQEFGLTRLRLSAAVAIGFVGLVLVLVALAGRSARVARALPRTLVVLAGATVLGVAVARPDAIIATQQIEAFGPTAELDVGYLVGLSADAAPAITTLPDDYLADRLAGPDVGRWTSWCGREASGGSGWTAWNASRARAQRLAADVATCDPTASP